MAESKKKQSSKAKAKPKEAELKKEEKEVIKKVEKPKLFCKKNYGRVQLPTGGGLDLYSGQPVLDKMLRRTLESVGIEFEDDQKKCD